MIVGDERAGRFVLVLAVALLPESVIAVVWLRGRKSSPPQSETSKARSGCALPENKIS
jgi:hypothetical protein